MLSLSSLQGPSERLTVLSLKKNHGRLLGVDVGSKRLGLALSDSEWMIASPYLTHDRQALQKDAQALQKIVQEMNIAALILGLPVNMNGTHGPRCQSVRQFAQNIHAFLNLPFFFWDERLSTVAVTRTLLDADMSRKRRAEVVDKMAAAFILQGVLDYLRVPVR